MRLQHEVAIGLVGLDDEPHHELLVLNEEGLEADLALVVEDLRYVLEELGVLLLEEVLFLADSQEVGEVGGFEVVFKRHGQGAVVAQEVELVESGKVGDLEVHLGAEAGDALAYEVVVLVAVEAVEEFDGGEGELKHGIVLAGEAVHEVLDSVVVDIELDLTYGMSEGGTWEVEN